jgi:hypothetical protein
MDPAINFVQYTFGDCGEKDEPKIDDDFYLNAH